LAFCVLPVPGSPLETEELLEDPYLLLVPADSPLLEAAEVPLQVLSSLPLIGYRGCRTQERVDSYLRGIGIDLNRVAYAGDNAIIQGMVAAGRGAALLTRLAIDETEPRTATLPLEEWVPPRRVGLGWLPEQRSVPALRAFVQTARNVTRASRSGRPRSGPPYPASVRDGCCVHSRL
jgi:DNA-binding transcriptional LysR family regulator